MKNIINSIQSGPGYLVCSAFKKNDLQRVKEYVEAKFIEHLSKISFLNLDKFKNNGISKYHLNSNLIDHNNSWPRNVRLFDKIGIDIIMNTPFYKNLEKTFNDIEITNEIGKHDPEIVWRIVRPNELNDIGPIHTDKWFWEANKWKIPKNKKCVKVWIMLDGETNNSGLSVIPNSHKNLSWEYSFEKRDGIQKPLFDLKKNKLEPKILETNPGDAVIFSYNLLHGGAVTRGNLCRTSLEFTLFTPK